MPTLYRKYRPRHWSDVVGQPSLVTTLTNALKHNLIAHAYLFTGPRGTGKTTVARLFAQSLNCAKRLDNEEPCGTCPNCLAFEDDRAFDIIEIDGASNNGVENIRELRETIKLPPSLGEKKIYILDEVHMLSTGAWSALLKTLEEPPAHVVFILATTELRKIPDTIISRSQRFNFSALSTNSIIEKLFRIAVEENIVIDPDAIEMIALAAEGGMRDAESLLAQVMSLEDTHITGAEAASILGISEQKTIVEYVEALGRRDLDSTILILESLSQTGADFRSFAGALLYFLRELLFRKLRGATQKKLAIRKCDENFASFDRLAAQFSFPELSRLLEIIHHARKEIRFASMQQLPLEIAALAFIFPEGTESKIGSRQNIEPSLSLRKSSSPTPQEDAPAKKEAFLKEKKEISTKKEEEATLSLSLIREKWPLFLEEIKRQNISLALSLSNASLKILERETLTISVGHAFHKERLEKTESRAIIENALIAIFDKKIRILIEYVPGKSVANPSDPITKSALEILGGKIVS